MAFRTGVPRRENQLAGAMGTSATSVVSEFDKFGEIEPYSLAIANRKELNAQYDDQMYNSRQGVVIRRWGAPGEQQFEQAVKVLPGSDDVDAAAWEKYHSTAGTASTSVPPISDYECCAWLRIKAPSSVKSGSTSGISAGAKRGCVYYWSIEGCNPSYWGCGSLAAAGTGGSGAGLHQTSLGMVFIAPTIPDAKTINCGRTVDTKIKVAILTSDGQKQAAAAVGTAGWSGFGMGPGDELYDLFGPENVCDDTANITTVADDCNDGDCANVHIGYASNTMGVSEYQGLVAVGATSDMDIRWENTGGGSLSGSGVNVVYSSPPSNWNCEESGYIKLYCNGVLVDSLKLGVTVFIYTWVAYVNYQLVCDLDIYHNESLSPSCPYVNNYVATDLVCTYPGYCNTGCCQTYYDCAGRMYSRGMGSFEWDWVPLSVTCAWLTQATNCDIFGEGNHDIRQSYMMDAACCPPEM